SGSYLLSPFFSKRSAAHRDLHSFLHDALPILLAQTLTNLVIVPAGSGLPSGWKLSRLQGVEPPSFEVTRGHTLRIIAVGQGGTRSEEHTSELQSRSDLVCRLLLEKKKSKPITE